MAESSVTVENVSLEISSGKGKTATIPTFMENVADETKNYINQKFNYIETVLIQEIEGLEDSIPSLIILKKLIEMVEHDGKEYKLDGKKKQEVVIVICLKLGEFFKESENPELNLLSSILSNEKAISVQIETLFKIHKGELVINLNDGLKDEIEIVTSCSSFLFNPCYKYLLRRCSSNKKGKV